MPEAEADRDTKNRQIIERLRAAFVPLLERLTPETEPATVYLPETPISEPEE